MRPSNSQEDLLVLKRYAETNAGLPTDSDMIKHRHGAVNFAVDSEDSGRTYAMPDACIVTDVNIDDTDRVDGRASYTHNEINLAERYSQQNKLTNLHNALGHSNMQRIATMRNWDGQGPPYKPNTAQYSSEGTTVWKAPGSNIARIV